MDFMKLLREEKERLRGEKVIETKKKEGEDVVMSKIRCLDDEVMEKTLSTGFLDAKRTCEFVKDRVKDRKEDLMYVNEMLTADEEAELMIHIDSGKWIRLKRRRLQQFGGTPGKRKEKLPNFLQHISETLVKLGLFPREFTPNHVLINEYVSGQGIMPHKDGPLYYPNVVILSLLGPCRFDFFRNSVPRRDDEPHDSLLVSPRSLLRFRDCKYTDCWHGIKASVSDIIKSHTRERGDYSVGDVIPRGSRRVSLTFRHVFSRETS